MHDAYIGGCSENNIKRVAHDDLGQKNQTTGYILPRLMSVFLSFIVVKHIRFFHGALQLLFYIDSYCTDTANRKAWQASQR